MKIICGIHNRELQANFKSEVYFVREDAKLGEYSMIVACPDCQKNFALADAIADITKGKVDA